LVVPIRGIAVNRIALQRGGDRRAEQRRNSRCR